MVINRRRFGLGLATLIGCAGFGGRTTASTGEITTFVTSARDRLSGHYKAIGLGSNLQVVWAVVLPGRAHGPVSHPRGQAVVMVARRPDRFVEVRNTIDGALLHRFNAVPGRHFYGHGVFDPSGRYLFLTENDYQRGDGVVGVYDASDNYKRLEEISSGGIGPHQIVLSTNGRSLVIANGGILTHPDRGREKLNLDTMRPSLQMVDIETGTPEQSYRFSDQSFNNLSMRHIAALKDGRIVVGCQNQRTTETPSSLMYISDGGSETLTPLQGPGHVLGKINGYVGSVAVSGDGRLIAAACPRGGLVSLWESDTLSFFGAIDLADACGLAASRDSDDLLATSGNGFLVPVNPGVASDKHVQHPFLQWDNHAIRI